MKYPVMRNAEEGRRRRERGDGGKATFVSCPVQHCEARMRESEPAKETHAANVFASDNSVSS